MKFPAYANVWLKYISINISLYRIPFWQNLSVSMLHVLVGDVKCPEVTLEWYVCFQNMLLFFQISNDYDFLLSILSSKNNSLIIISSHSALFWFAVFLAKFIQVSCISLHVYNYLATHTLCWGIKYFKYFRNLWTRV